MAATVSIPAGHPFCVYVHSVEGRIMYVGKGVASRPFSRQNRNAAWKAEVGCGSYDVTILRWFATDLEALRAEAGAIRRLRPPCNMEKDRGPPGTKCPKSRKARAAAWVDLKDWITSPDTKTR